MALNLPDRIGNTLTASPGPLPAHGLLSALGERLASERGRWPLWLPVCLGTGVAIYFGLHSEPPGWVGVVALALAATVAALGRLRLAVFLPAVVAAAIALGFTACQVRTNRVAAPVLERYTGALTIEGKVVEVEMLPGGGARISMSPVSLDRPDVVVPAKARIKVPPGSPAISAGDRIRTRATLMPPPQPAMPGAYDFPRFAYFNQLGALGTALDPPEVLPSDAPAGWRDGWRVMVNDLRHRLTARILAVLQGDRGAVTAALMTGDQMPITGPMMQAYRDSGLAHILSISGLHMTLAAGLVFFVLRGALALVPPVALRFPIKKWAAALAILATWFYMLLAGSPVPAQRSFFMTGIVLVAVLLDRVALSMRLVAWAAVAVLLYEPEEMIGPSFQMSFAAVAALISAYEVLTPKQGAWRAGHPGITPAVALYLFGVTSSTLIAGTATAVYGVYHFNRFAVYSVVANLIAVPLTGFWVMPWALLAFVLMPLGLESVALVPLGWGVEGVNMVAVWVAAWPVAAITLPPLPTPAMLLFTLGLCWLLIWKSDWRLWGILPMAAGLAAMAFGDPPDLLVDGRGDAYAVRTVEGALLSNGKGGRIVKETWQRRAGPEARERWPKHSSSRDGRLRCDPLGCLWRANGHVVAIVREEGRVEEACAGADTVVSSVPLRGGCRGARVVVDRFDLWRQGAHAVWVRPEGVRIETVASWQGDRPWAWHPHPKKKAQPQPQPQVQPPAADAPGRDGDED
jgi:competence protein ComEC